MLTSRSARPTTVSGKEARLFLGKGSMPFEVVVLDDGERRPTLTELRNAFRDRAGRRPAPVLVVWRWGNDKCAVYGPNEHNPVEFRSLPVPEVESVCEIVLDAADRHHGIRTLHQLLPQLDSRIPGLRNGGLLAMQELEHGVPNRGDWTSARKKAAPVRKQRGRSLIQDLGFETEDLPGPGMILYAGGSKRAVAVLLDRHDEIDVSSDRFDGTSPVSFAVAIAARENLEYVLIAADSSLRLYPAKSGVGVGQRGQSETYVELNLDLLPEEQAAYLWLLFSAEALEPGGSFEEVLSRSEDYAADLSGRLREKVYLDVVPRVARAVFEALGVQDPGEDDLTLAYDVALRVLFRTLFVAYAEDRDLLPLHSSRTYREHSLKRMAQRLAEARESGVEWSDEPHLWSELRQLWRAVDRGSPEWRVPAYNGGLFSSDPEVAESGAILQKIEVPDSKLAPALGSLLLDETDEGVEGPVDFRSLGVREFGTMYEGLLESELAVAETDLRELGKKKELVPAEEGQDVDILEGEVYLHNRSGARKTTGSYYTKSFAVEHLLDRALEPALDEHLERMDEMSDREAGRRFFEFRVADIAMGSGHFLVAAVDRIERRLVSYLTERPLQDVTEEVARLRSVAMERLGDDWGGDPIEDAQLLRRQIARRCIYGVDLNPMAVELARVSLWIHTFVPGLPLSLLDENLVCGNSLVGIATFEEATELIGANRDDLFAPVTSQILSSVVGPLERLGKLADASGAEIAEARELYDELREGIWDEEDLFTILTASRIDSGLADAIDDQQITALLEGRLDDDRQAELVERSEAVLAGHETLHFPLTFPQVFIGERRGFDVIVGNPPWEEATVEEDAFWARHFPGLRGMSSREQEARKEAYREERPDLVEMYQKEKAEAEALREVLSAGAYPGMGTGDPDLYKAFVWRFWHLVSEAGGRIGVVLPRSALLAKGSGDFRKAMLSAAETVDLTMLLNNRRWVFSEVHPQYTIGLTAITRRRHEEGSRLLLRGPFPNLERFKKGREREPVGFPGSEVRKWNDHASFPLLPSDTSAEVFSQLRKSPRMDLDEPGQWRARPYAELHATDDKDWMDLKSEKCPKGFWPVFKGESFDLWDPDTGTYYHWANPEVMIPHLQAKRQRAVTAFIGFSGEWIGNPGTLPCYGPRIAFRDSARATDTRTVRCALVPPRVFVANQAPTILWPRGDELDEAFLLGLLSSLPLDWYARRYVENHLSFFIINPFPIPRPKRDNPLWRRVVALAGRMAAPDERFAEWAESVGVECGALAEDEQQDMIHELDAVVAHLYGLSEAHLTHIFETFHEGWDPADRLEATLEHFRAWEARR